MGYIFKKWLKTQKMGGGGGGGGVNKPSSNIFQILLYLMKYAHIKLSDHVSISDTNGLGKFYM